MTKKRKLEAQSSEPAEPSQKQTTEEEQQLGNENQEDVEEVEREEVEEEHEEEVEDIDDEEDDADEDEEVEDDDDEEDDVDEDENNQTTGNRTEAAATSGHGNQGDGDDDDDEPIKDLLEPFSKEQLLSLLKEAAEKHLDVANGILEVAEENPAHRRIFVHNLGSDTKTETLIEAFKQYGDIEDCKAVCDKISGKSKGYGFILYKFRSSARHALKQPQKKIGSRMWACQLASKGPFFGETPISAAAVSAPAQHSNSEHTQKKIFVRNVGPELDPQKLLAFFSRFGEIEEGPLGLDKFTGRPKGFCLFVYKSSESAKRALEEPHKNFEGHVLYCEKAVDCPKSGKHQHHQKPHSHNNPLYQRNDNSGYDTSVGYGHLMAGNQGAGLAYYPAIGQATGYGGMPTGYGTQAMAPGTIPGYGTQPGLQGGYQTPQLDQGGTGTGQHGVGPYGSPYMGQ